MAASRKTRSGAKKQTTGQTPDEQGAKPMALPLTREEVEEAERLAQRLAGHAQAMAQNLRYWLDPHCVPIGGGIKLGAEGRDGPGEHAMLDQMRAALVALVTPQFSNAEQREEGEVLRIIQSAASWWKHNAAAGVRGTMGDAFDPQFRYAETFWPELIRRLDTPEVRPLLIRAALVEAAEPFNDTEPDEEAKAAKRAWNAELRRRGTSPKKAPAWIAAAFEAIKEINLASGCSTPDAWWEAVRQRAKRWEKKRSNGR